MSSFDAPLSRCSSRTAEIFRRLVRLNEAQIAVRISHVPSTLRVVAHLSRLVFSWHGQPAIALEYSHLYPGATDDQANGRNKLARRFDDFSQHFTSDIVVQLLNESCVQPLRFLCWLPRRISGYQHCQQIEGLDSLHHLPPWLRELIASICQSTFRLSPRWQ